MNIRLPLVDLEKHGAQLLDTGGAGFAMKVASGSTIGNFAPPPDPWLFEHSNPTSAPVSTWAAQHMLVIYAEFDAESLKLKRDDTISETERLRRLHLIRKKAEDAMAHIELAFAAEEEKAQAVEKGHYSWPPIDANDFVGALRENEIRAGLRAMPKDALKPLYERLNAGEERPILMAILRSPLAMGILSEFATHGWRTLRDRENPEARAGLDMRAKYNDWSRRIVGAVQGSLAAKLRGT